MKTATPSSHIRPIRVWPKGQLTVEDGMSIRQWLRTIGAKGVRPGIGRLREKGQPRQVWRVQW